MVSILKEYELKRMTDLYRKGIVSLQEAATQAKLFTYVHIIHTHILKWQI